jgi:hypothetical protein
MMSEFESKINRLTELWYQHVSLDYHKDRDCHWYIQETWSYGQPPYYTAQHWGYVFTPDEAKTDEWTRYPTMEAAEEGLYKLLLRAFDQEQLWAREVVANPEQYDDEQIKMAHNILAVDLSTIRPTEAR